MRVALYVRRSTDDKLQPESLVIQEERLRAFAASRGATVVAVFTDSASGVTTKRRSGFAALIASIQQGPVDFEAVVVRDVTRWGRFVNIDESAYWEFVCVAHGVKVIYAEETFNDAPRPYDALLKAIRRMYAAEFSREKSRLVPAAQASIVARGFRIGGAPFGMRKVEVRGEAGRAQRTHFMLEPTDDHTADVVRHIFRSFVEDDLSTIEIARMLNRTKEPSPRGKTWSAEAVLDVLRNPVYAGIAEARFAASPNFPEPTVISRDNSWEPLIMPSVFAAARSKVGARPAFSGGPAEQIRQALTSWEWSGDIDTAVRLCRERVTPLIGAVTRRAVEQHDASLLRSIDSLLADVHRTGTFNVQQFYSFPRIHSGRASWEFPVTVVADGYLLIGLSPPPDVRIVQMYFLLGRRFRRLRVLRPELRLSWFAKRNGVTMETLRSRVEPHLYATVRAEETFIDAVRGRSVISTQAISRQLGWSEEAGHAVFSRLRKHGVALPDLAWRVSKALVLVCETCGAESPRSVRGAMRTRTHLCKRCQTREYERSHRIATRCVICEAPRYLSRSAPLPTMQRANDKCRSCAGRVNIVAAKHAALQIARSKREAYTALQSDLMSGFRSRYGAAILLKGRKTAPSREMAFPIDSLHGKVYVLLSIRTADTAARLLVGTTLRRISRHIAKDVKRLPPNKRATRQVIDVDALLGGQGGYRNK